MIAAGLERTGEITPRNTESCGRASRCAGIGTRHQNGVELLSGLSTKVRFQMHSIVPWNDECGCAKRTLGRSAFCQYRDAAWHTI